jgi:hypothetical protein
MHRTMYRSTALLLCCAISSLGAQPPTGKPGLPFVKLRVSGQKADRSDSIVYLLDLNCSTSSCELQMTELNECSKRPDESSPAFTLRTRTWASWAGFVQVTSQSEHEISLIAYQVTHKGLPAKFTFQFDTDESGKQTATSFTANGVLNAQRFPQEIKTFDLEPYGAQRKNISLDCPMRLGN